MKKKLLLITIVLVLMSLGINAQTTFSWRNDQNPTSGQWNVANYWWNGSGAELPGGGEILFLDGSIGLDMTNDLPATNRFRIIFGAGGDSRTIAGSTENTFYDFGGNHPKIENNSSNIQTINFPISLGYNPMEINPVSGDILIGGTINNDGNYIDVYGNNNNVLNISGIISGIGGFTNKDNNYLLFISNNTYSGPTTLDGGTLELRGSLVNSALTVKSGATLKINGDDVTVASLTVESGGNVEIVAVKSLTVSGNLSNSGTFTIKSDVSGTGSLIVNGTVTGDITTERYIPAANWATGTDGWHLLSSPVASQAITGGWTPDGTSSNNYDFYAWNEANNIWVNFKNTTTSPTWDETNGNANFTVGRGYVVAYQAESTNTFTGTPNKDDVVVNTLTRTTGAYADADDAGFNVLGNPFPSAIKWNDGNWTLTGISTTAKLWNSTGKSYDDLGVNGIIPANNGFVVQLTTGTTGSITIPKASRTHDATNWQKSGDQNKVRLIAREADNNSAQSSNIVLNAAASENYDPLVDATFLGGYAPMFYSKKDDHHLSTYALASVSDDLTIPYGFVSNGASEYAIELTENIDGQTIYLTDLKTNTSHNLSENPVYSFTASSGDSPDRFLLHFGVVGIGEKDQATTLHAYAYNNRLYVNNSLEKAHLAVYDLQGRLLMQQSANTSGLQSLPLDLPAGVYVVRLSNAQEAMSVKINVQ